MGEAEVLDLEEIVKDYAISFLDSSQRRYADTENPIIDYDRMTVIYGDSKYVHPNQPPKPVSNVLFSAMFSNNTPEPQTYALSTERRTKSSCTISFNKTFSYGVNISMQMAPPTPSISANTGFQSNMTKTKGTTQTYERELNWSVNNNISVPPGYQTKAEMIIKEDSFDGHFEVPVYFEGLIVVTFENKKREHVSTIRAPVKRLFANQRGFSTDEKGRPVYHVTGECKCRFGIEQSVKLTEMPLQEDSDAGEEKEEVDNKKVKELTDDVSKMTVNGEAGKAVENGTSDKSGIHTE